MLENARESFFRIRHRRGRCGGGGGSGEQDAKKEEEAECYAIFQRSKSLEADVMRKAFLSERIRRAFDVSACKIHQPDVFFSR